MTQAAVAAEVHQSLDVRCSLATKIAFDGVITVDGFADLQNFGVGQFVMGPLSDRFGRRPVLLGGMVLYVIASVLAIAAPSFETILLARALQGLGTSATRVIATSIVRDCYAGRRMASVMSLAMMVFIAVPVIAPSFGQAVMLLTQWRGIFIVLMVMLRSLLAPLYLLL